MRQRTRNLLATLLLLVSATLATQAQVITTTTVQGTIYNAQGHPATGTLQITWPAFTC